MKRMNLIRATLFAVCVFMGSISVSAQGNWVTPNEAKQIIPAELNLMSQPTQPPSAPPVLGMTGAQMAALTGQNSCTDCILNSVKKVFLKETMIKLLQGATQTGVAVDEVRTFLLSRSGNNPTMIAAIQEAYLYMDSKL